VQLAATGLVVVVDEPFAATAVSAEFLGAVLFAVEPMCIAVPKFSLAMMLCQMKHGQKRDVFR